MAQSTRTGTAGTAAYAAVFAPLDAAGRAEVVEQRISDAILLGVLGSGERLPNEVDLARQFNVATVTAREALESLRGKGLVHTKRGRGGGSFVRARDDAHGDRLVDAVTERVRRMSRVELRDVGVHYSALAGHAAALAADRASSDDVEALELLLRSLDSGTDAAARRAESTLRLEIAALSQSARLVREHLRLQAEFGPLLWLNLRLESNRERSAQQNRAVVAAIADEDGDTARRLTEKHIGEAVEWLIEMKARLETEE